MSVLQKCCEVFREALPHLNILLLLGVALFGGTVGGRLFQKMRVPQVVGYMAIGILLGVSGLRVIDEETGDELKIDNQYVMSPKDLCTIGFLDKLIKAGATVFKIEGRARKADYVMYDKPDRRDEKRINTALWPHTIAKHNLLNKKIDGTSD